MRRLLLTVTLLSHLLGAPAWSGIQLDGVDDSLVGLVLSNYITAADATVMAWFTGEGTSPTGASTCVGTQPQGVVGNSGASTVRLFIARYSATQVCIAHRDTAPATITINANHTDGAHAHVTLRHTGGTVFMYLQGVLVSSTANGDTASLTNNFQLGGGNTGTPGRFQGIIDMVATWNTALPVEEIAAIATGRRVGLHKTMPTALWSFSNCNDGDSANGVVFQDLSGNGRTLTASGTVCKGSAVLSRRGGIQ